MLLTITTTQRPATDLAELLHQDLDRVHLSTASFGYALLCFSQADEARCTAAVVVHSERRALSLLGLAVADLFDEALGKARIDAPRRGPLPIEVEAPLVPCTAEPTLVRRLFEPLGYHVAAAPVPSDPRRAESCRDDELALRLTGLVGVPELLSHLCVLLPILDGDSCAGRLGEADRESLWAHGADWVDAHPERALVERHFATRVGAGSAVG